MTVPDDRMANLGAGPRDLRRRMDSWIERGVGRWRSIVVGDRDPSSGARVDPYPARIVGGSRLFPN